MASRYWVGGTGNWNVSGNWASSSGGSGGAGVPGSSDDAIFDSSSGTGTCTVNVAVDIVNLTCTGFTGTLDQNGYTMQISGNWTVPTGMTFDADGLVQFDGSGASQSLTMDASSNSFDDLRNSITESGGYDLDLASDIRVTGTLTIDTGCRLHANSNDIFIRGSGSGQVVLNGWVYCLSSAFVFEVNGGGTTTIPSATGWNVNGSLTGAVLSVKIISNVTATIRLGGNISDILIFNVLPDPAVTSATVAFYTDNYNITCSVNMTIGGNSATENDACAFTSYWGSSTINFTNTTTQFIRWIWSGATHNLQTATFTTMNGATGQGGLWSVGGPSTGWVDVAQTFNVGTSQVYCRSTGESWMGLGSHDGVAKFYNLTLSNPGAMSYCYIKTVVTNKMALGDNGSTLETSVECQNIIDVAELEIKYVYSGGGFEFYESGINDVDTFDLDGSAGYVINIRSRVATTQATVRLVNPGSATYTNVQDNLLTGSYMDMTGTGNVDNGNNSQRWIFDHVGFRHPKTEINVPFMGIVEPGLAIKTA